MSATVHYTIRGSIPKKDMSLNSWGHNNDMFLSLLCEEND